MGITKYLIKKIDNTGKLFFSSLMIFYVISVLIIMPAHAANGTLYATGFTAPGGQVWMGTHLWVSAGDQGFCRLDDTGALNGNFTINAATCVGGGKPIAGPKSPGQPAFDEINNTVYVPDGAATLGRGGGVWRLKFNPLTERITGAVLIGSASFVGSGKPIAAALGPDGNLYVGYKISSNITQITNPNGVLQGVIPQFGMTSDGKKDVSGLAFIGQDLYIAEKGGITTINISTQMQGGLAMAVIGITATGPTAITSDGSDVLFIADTPLPDGVSTIQRFNVITGIQDTFADTAILAGRPVPFLNVAGLALDPLENLFASDDPTAGAGVLQGRMWIIVPPPMSSGGAVTLEPLGNIAASDTDVLDLIANKWVTYEIDGNKHAIYEIAVLSEETQKNIPVRCEKLKGPSTLVTAFEGPTYMNQNVWSGSKNIKEALVRFRVSNAWITSNGLNNDNVVMQQWNGNKWTPLATKVIATDGTYTSFEATTDAFAPLAITGVNGAETKKTPDEKAAGFEVFLAIITLSATYLLGKKR